MTRENEGSKSRSVSGQLVGAAVVFCCVLPIGRPTIAADTLIEVADVTWTREVRDLQFTNQYAEGGSAPGAPIYLWTRMRGSPQGLAELQTEGKLPIRHRWIRYSGTEADIDTVSPTDQIALGVGTADLVPKLRREVDERGWFDWRTWSGKANVRPGKWRVDIVYKTGEPVLCGRNDGQQPKPCRYYIDVSR